MEDPFGVLNEIRNAGSIFLGRNVPEALGDYFAGPNHTLPTSGTARFSSPLGVDDFVKKSSFIYYTREALGAVAPRIADFAEREGLHAHAERDHPLSNDREETLSVPFPAPSGRCHPYTPGEQPQDQQYIKLNTNESPYPAGPAVVAGERARGGKAAPLLRPRLRPPGNGRRRTSVQPDQIMPGNGSDENLALRCGPSATKPPAGLCRHHLRLLRRVVQLLGSPDNHPAEGGLHPVTPRITTAFTETIVIANPNAPTGIALPRADRGHLEGQPGQCGHCGRGLCGLWRRELRAPDRPYENLLVVQTFSKSRQLAGARLGLPWATRS